MNATGDTVIAAALEWDEAWLARHHAVNRSIRAEQALLGAVAAHREAIAREHVQGPDIDAPRQPATPDPFVPEKPFRREPRMPSPGVPEKTPKGGRRRWQQP